MSNTIKNISLERLHSIEQERALTQSSKDFQKWCKDLRIGIMYKDRTGIENAKRMMQDWSMVEENSLRDWMPEFIRRMY